MGACHRRPLNEVKCKARVGYWQPRRCRWGAGDGAGKREAFLCGGGAPEMWLWGLSCGFDFS